MMSAIQPSLRWLVIWRRPWLYSRMGVPPRTAAISIDGMVLVAALLKSALIVFNGGHCTLGCQMLDMSATGALVRPSDILLCPSEFVLQPRVGSPRFCEVVCGKPIWLEFATSELIRENLLSAARISRTRVRVKQWLHGVEFGLSASRR